MAGGTHRHVEAAVAGRFLHGDVVAEGGEVGVEHAGVEALVIGDNVVGVPLIGNAGEERVEQFLHAGAVAGGQQTGQTNAALRRPGGILHQEAKQAAVQTLAHFAIRIAQPVYRLAADLLFRLDRKIAGLEQQRLGADVVRGGAAADVERRQQFFGTEHIAK